MCELSPETVTTVKCLCFLVFGGRWVVGHVETAVLGGGSCERRGQDTFTKLDRKPGGTSAYCKWVWVCAHGVRYVSLCVHVGFLTHSTSDSFTEKSFTVGICGCDTKQALLESSPGSSRGQVSELVCFNRIYNSRIERTTAWVICSGNTEAT